MTEYLTSEGDTADFIAWKYYGTQDGSVVEQLVDANPGLADRGPVLAAGILLHLPEIKSVGVTQGVKLWD